MTWSQVDVELPIKIKKKKEIRTKNVNKKKDD